MNYKKDRIVPRNRMLTGIEVCKNNIEGLLKDAKLLITKSSFCHAYIFVQFAIEELGKILIFREKLETDLSDPLVIPKREAFTHNPMKIQKALKFLGEDVNKVCEGGFERGFFEKAFEQETYVEHQTRCDCAFVDFYGSVWHVGASIKKELLVNLINRIEEKLPDA